ncbi:MAG TPA: hypothetical protein VFW90_03310 [Candidatus Saccharimonadales bacterium]|nr:hypothetical protein [Candidatus Saccharimonadales bacterium]
MSAVEVEVEQAYAQRDYVRAMLEAVEAARDSSEEPTSDGSAKTAQSPKLLAMPVKEERQPYRGRFLTKAVCERNALHGAKRWWQPSKATLKVSSPRAAEVKAAIADDESISLAEAGRIAATVEFVEEAQECEVTVERPRYSVTEIAVVVMPTLGLSPRVEFADDEYEPDPALVALMEGEDRPELTEESLPVDFFHPTRADHMPPMPTPAHITRRQLSVAPQEMPDDWGDHETVYATVETPYLLSSL